MCGLISRDLFVPQVGSTILQCSSPSKAVRYTGGWLGCFGWVFLKTHFQRLMCRASSAVFRVDTCQKQHHSRRYHIKAIVSCYLSVGRCQLSVAVKRCQLSAAVSCQCAIDMLDTLDSAHTWSQLFSVKRCQALSMTLLSMSIDSCVSC